MRHWQRVMLGVIGVILAAIIIKIVANYLYFPDKHHLGFVELYRLLWQTGEYYYQLIVIMNVVIKPLLVFYFIFLLMGLR